MYQFYYVSYEQRNMIEAEQTSFNFSKIFLEA